MELCIIWEIEKLILFDWGHVIQDSNSVIYNLEVARRNICINIDTAEKMDFCTCLATGEECDKIKKNINKFLNEDSEVV